MTGEFDLGTLIASMSPVLHDDTFVFVTLPPDDMLATLPPARMMFQEAEGTTLILTQTQAQTAGLAAEFPCRMITLNVHSALDAVGFIARIATRLAALDMGVNPVAGFYHDHLFVPLGREDDAIAALTEMAANARN